MIRRVILLAALCLSAVGAVVAQSERLTIPPRIEQVAIIVIPGQRPTMVIRPVVPDIDPLCAERRDGFVACRTVGEFRSWVQSAEKK
jgi:hypothetical protein